jgi:para-nitrobenzyl esterase
MVEKGEFSELYQGCIAFSHKLEEQGRGNAWVYYFDHDLPGDELGAWHSCELWYMFGTLERCWRPWQEKDRVLSERMLDYWTNFMKTGDPNGGGPSPVEALHR